MSRIREIEAAMARRRRAGTARDAGAIPVRRVVVNDSSMSQVRELSPQPLSGGVVRSSRARWRPAGIFCLIGSDLRRKAQWCYETDAWPAITKVLLTDGTAAMLFYRLMQWSRRWRLVPLEMLFNKLNAVVCNCII